MYKRQASGREILREGLGGALLSLSLFDSASGMDGFLSSVVGAGFSCTAVSYTHLDVYKRQVLTLTMMMMRMTRSYEVLFQAQFLPRSLTCVGRILQG